ncbi:MAG: ribonuclease HIII [Melioribacteraceae bacterium]
MNLEEKAKKHIQNLKKLVSNTNLSTDEIILKQYNYEFNAVYNKSTVKVLVFFGKKGVKTIIQGDEKSDLCKKVKDIISDELMLELVDPELKEPEEYIGTDECGKGDFFGPLVVAAVFVNSDTKKNLLRVGVKDSKDLSDYQINLLAKEIKKIVGDNFTVVSINPKKYNEVYERFGNLNSLLNWAHSKALSNLFDKVDCKTVITDKFSNKDLDISSLSKHSDVEFIQETKAERYVGVAAASIIARESFLDWFENKERIGLNLPKGSSIETEVFAKKLLNSIGKEKLSELAKLHFKTYKKIKSNR